MKGRKKGSVIGKLISEIISKQKKSLNLGSFRIEKK